MILTAYDPNQVADPFKSVLDFGLGIFGHSIDNAISLGKQSNDLQNQQGAQFFSLLNDEQRQRQRQFEFAVGQANTNRAFDESTAQFDATFNEGARKFDATFNEGVRLNDRAFDYTKERDTVSDTRAERQFALQSFQVGNAVANANDANRRANVAEPLIAAERGLDIAAKSQGLADSVEDRARRDAIVKQSSSLLDIDAKTGVQSVKPDASLSALQDFTIANQGERDPRVQSAVGIAAAETSRRIKKATVEQLTPEVAGLRTEIADLNSKIGDPTTPTAIKDDFSKRIIAKEKLVNDIVERFPELARPVGGLPGGAASGAVNYQNLLKSFGIATPPPPKK